MMLVWYDTGDKTWQHAPIIMTAIAWWSGTGTFLLSLMATTMGKSKLTTAVQWKTMPRPTVAMKIPAMTPRWPKGASSWQMMRASTAARLVRFTAFAMPKAPTMVSTIRMLMALKAFCWGRQPDSTMRKDVSSAASRRGIALLATSAISITSRPPLMIISRYCVSLTSPLPPSSSSSLSFRTRVKWAEFAYSAEKFRGTSRIRLSPMQNRYTPASSASRF
mmetsp:Transcript_105548/g.251502  ORF Transcript_105548/g.251502 Transcript_105548/m.251502 type:complete len:220 (-) Transcript_105548:1859-2518(-)